MGADHWLPPGRRGRRLTVCTSNQEPRSLLSGRSEGALHAEQDAEVRRRRLGGEGPSLRGVRRARPRGSAPECFKMTDGSQRQCSRSLCLMSYTSDRPTACWWQWGERGKILRFTLRTFCLLFTRTTAAEIKTGETVKCRTGSPPVAQGNLNPYLGDVLGGHCLQKSPQSTTYGF